MQFSERKQSESCSGDSIVLDLMCAYLLVLCSALIITLPFLAGTVDKHCLVLFGNQFSFELQAEEVVSDHYIGAVN